jgi:adenylate cyclase class 2
VPTEHEAKVLDINPDDVKNRILAAGGKQAAEARLMRRYVYDIVPGDMSRWIRLRDSGTETTLCVKEIRSDAIDGTLEVETAVGDFAAANDLLGMLGYPEGQLTGENTIKVYARHGIDLTAISDLRFPDDSR